MLPESRLRKGKSLQDANVVPKFRETPMTKHEPRYYKEVYRTNKNIG